MRTPPLNSVALPDRYRVTGFLAAGGMAGVWSAHDELLDRRVAIKVLAEHLATDADAARRFQREARAAAGLSSHPHVVTIYDVGEHQGRPFIVMELLPGGTVAGRLEQGRVDRALALRWIAEAGSALDAAHAAGVVHRDIKPGNLLLDEHDRLAVADFGIARLVHDAEQHTATGVVLGTAAYLAPEQAMGEATTDASDRYALAVVAFELLCGRRPFQAEHFAAQARQHIEAPPPDASAVAPDLPRAVDDVLHCGLAKDPAHRWASCEALVGALGTALEEPLAGGRRPPRLGARRRSPRRRLPRPRASRAPASAGCCRRWCWWRCCSPAARSRRSSPAAMTVATRTAAPTRARLRARARRGAAALRRRARPQHRPSRPRRPRRSRPRLRARRRPATTAARRSATALNNDGYALYQQGNYGEAIPLLTRAVERCGGSDALDPCGYAYFNLGSALLRAGRPQEAIPLLEARLARWKFKDGDVKRELKAARKAAGGGKPHGGKRGGGKRDED